MTKISKDTLKKMSDHLSSLEFMVVEGILVSRAFDDVCDQEDWMGPIDKVICVKSVDFTLDFYEYAIRYMTSTAPSITETQTLAQNGQVRITAAGYRAAPSGP